MRNLKFFLFLGLIFLMFSGVAYADDNEQVICETQLTAVISLGNLVVVFAEADSSVDRWGESDRLKKWLANTLSGDYRVNRVKTVYRSGFLSTVEVLYDTSGGGMNYGVMFSPDPNSWLCGRQRSAVVHAWLNDILVRKEMRVTNVQTVYKNGLLYAAEIYYLKDE